MFRSKRNDPSSHLLELEAADYFKLDPTQVNMLCNSSPLATSQQQLRTSTGGFTSPNVYVRPAATMNTTPDQSSSIRLQKSPTKGGTQQLGEPGARRRSQSECTQLIEAGPRKGTFKQPATSPRTSRQTKRSKAIRNKEETVRQQPPGPDQTLICSSITSTNSLPSISSSPSISPSLVCPHLTLDDILNGRYVSRSPHTIGLCDRCKLDPPPNIHSPLSPVFKPSSAIMNPANNRQVPKFFDHRQQQQQQQQPQAGRRMSSLRRGYSDFQGANARNKQTRDDSLDFYLEPSELRRSQMSPIQRNSVEFIRKYSTEVGRVLRVYKNGQAFEKPLRVCITRNEFANLNQLLDHINSRQLIPGGARYLFHMDGQLVYSVHELKHGSSYIVSGTRNFDTKASAVIKEQQKKELNQTHHLHEQLQRRLLDRRSSRSLGSLGQLARSDDTAEAAVMAYNLSELSKERPAQSASRARPPMTASSMIKPQTVMVDQVDRTSKQKVPLHTRDANSNKRRASPKQQQQQIRSNMSRSSENLNHTEADKSDPTMSKPKGGNLSRAKSELSSSALKRKKNVTFMDTGQSASPVMRRTKEVKDADGCGRTGPSVPESSISNNNKRTTDTEDKDKGPAGRNEIGIQVSDSIDGYLIDLPLPLPKRGDEKREQLEGRRRFVTMKGGKQQPAPSRTKKIVTITERDLSLDELDQLKDLDHGDHHSESHKIKHVIIKLDSADDNEPNGQTVEALKVALNTSGQKTETKGDQAPSEEAIDRTGTINIGQEDKERGDKLITKTNFDADSDMDKSGAAKTIPIGQWQYPGGEQSSATPEERPVSQNEPNGVVNARVTTPTPSLSTVGDNNSLSMSYDAAQIDGKLQQQDRVAATRKTLPAKNRIPVMGELSSGLDPPGKNFKLTWVNGFSINNLYPDNSTSAVSASSALSTGLLNEPSTLGGQEALLSPAKQAAMTAAIQRGAAQFKPSERYRNWICHSRLHDELIFPAGCLIVLWCRWTNEQRYYSRHVTNISAIALAPTQPDVVASAEIGGLGPDQQATSAAVIHLWSSTSLETLVIIDEPVHFRGFKVFSLSLRKLLAEESVAGWSLLVSSKDDKQTLQLQAIRVILANDSGAQKKTSVTIIRAPNRVLQPSQIPLLVSHVPVENEADAQIPSSPVKMKTQQARDLLLSFGRRHFQLWSPDWARQKLQLMAAGEKSGPFTEIMTRANCLVRLAPSEFLVGDTAGNISLFTISFPHQQRTPSKSLLKLSGDSPKSAAGSNNKFDVQIIRLVESQQQPDSQVDEQTSASRSSTPTGPLDAVCSITSLARVSGSVFASGHSNCVVRFWKIERAASDISCRQLTCLSLPLDLGFVCSILSSSFNWKQSIVEFYLISTSNAILFGSIQLASLNKPEATTDVLAHSSLAIVYEGHETSVTNLVADSTQAPRGKVTGGNHQQADGHYFTCSLDFKICKWNGKSLVWKSMLPSACVSLAVHPTGSALAIGSADGTVYVLDKVSGLLISYFPLTPVCINCLSYSHDGTLLAAGCANGSIFILPVQLNGLKYKKVSIFQSPFPVVSLQFSLDNRYLLTSVTHSQYQDLILWDLPNFRYMRDNVRMVADKIDWFEPVCSGSEDVRAIWENINLTTAQQADQQAKPTNRLARKRPSTVAALELRQSDQKFVVNLSCHRLIEHRPDRESLCIASDTRGHLRLFKYPCRDIEQAFYQARVTSSRLNCCRFLSAKSQSFVSSALDGSIFLWTLDSTQAKDGSEQ